MATKAKGSAKPAQKYYAIRDVVEITGIKAPTLRNWERMFPELQRVKRINNRRTYTNEDIEFILKKAGESTTRVVARDLQVQEQSNEVTSEDVGDLFNDDSSPKQQAQSLRTKEIKEKAKSIQEEISKIRSILHQIDQILSRER